MNRTRKPRVPAIFVANHQERVPLDLPRLEQLLPAAWEAVVQEAPGPADTLLPELEELEVSILSDEEISRQHEAFLGDPSPTDVITFQHGELLISADTAARESRSRAQPLERELLLYLLHGLLHLHGFGDQSIAERSQMHAIQDRLLSQLWPD